MSRSHCNEVFYFDHLQVWCTMLQNIFCRWSVLTGGFTPSRQLQGGLDEFACDDL